MCQYANEEIKAQAKAKAKQSKVKGLKSLISKLFIINF